MTVWAVVVTWNRRGLLERCLACLAAQTRPCARILVVDNASDDGTAMMLDRDWAGRVTVLSLPVNIGGAGGFNVGMRAAVEGGAERLWLMDDDVLPAPDALAQLLQAEAELTAEGRSAAFLCSSVRTPDGQLTNTPEIDTRKNALGYAAWSERLDRGLVPVRQATFVSVLISRAEVLRHGLPLAPMFIWGDDTEYTLRLSADRPGFLAAFSRVEHVRAAPGWLSLETETDPRRERLHRLLTRNIILAKRRHEGTASALRYAGSRARIAFRLARRGRWRKAGLLVAGLVDGARFDPKVEFCAP
ncbi:glycosyltransferase family 2 protein [Brevundimonas sp.]|jgi:GT2 family glycosyltransferase|uniref:glycosyltransferase family 2 protein n=1 Tax=Brevundimonas sp. TaxID=1871086 RepID=UPI0017C98827|nr:glycosyltransferase family 2 protein [Brevundimonas sp.]MBA4808022.1 glycosyltransferase family 2 protein [Brevundimonas sp.]